jgi:ubiquinone/menaquinone biosynthesis C-methylase UbiE
MEKLKEKDLYNSKELQGVVGKYRETNLISRLLVENFYTTIQKTTILIDPADRVLEVGCGAGISSLRILQFLHGNHFEVSDIDNHAINLLNQVDFPIPFMQESVLELKRKDREFDCIFLLEVLEHVRDYRNALSELFRVSKKYVVISVPNEPLWRLLNMVRFKYLRDFGNTPGHINHWSKSGIVNLISEYGKIIKVYSPLPWTIVVATVRP